jgi:hypothetical protein
LVAGWVPICVPITACPPFPECGLIIDQLILPIPESTPLYAVCHVVVTERAVELPNGILKFYSGVNGLKIIIQAARELKRTEKRIGAGCGFRFELFFNF